MALQLRQTVVPRRALVQDLHGLEVFEARRVLDREAGLYVDTGRHRCLLLGKCVLSRVLRLQVLGCFGTNAIQLVGVDLRLGSRLRRVREGAL